MPQDLHLPNLRHPLHPHRALRMSRPGRHRPQDFQLHSWEVRAIPAPMRDRLHCQAYQRLRRTFQLLVATIIPVVPDFFVSIFQSTADFQ